jgi:hypothetical protein
VRFALRSVDTAHQRLVIERGRAAAGVREVDLPVADGCAGRDAVESGHALKIPPRNDADGGALVALSAGLSEALGHGERFDEPSVAEESLQIDMGTAGLEPATSRV